jgi:hypothetical protein
MHSNPRAAKILVLAASIPLVSCGTLRDAGRSSVAMVKNSTSATVSKISSIPMPKLPDMHLANLLPGSRVKVVDVREKDLKDLPTGKERALAYRNERSGFWIFGGPVDFKEPTLPEPGADPDGSLLPPRMP